MIPFPGRRVIVQNIRNFLPNWQGIGKGIDATVVAPVV